VCSFKILTSKKYLCFLGNIIILSLYRFPVNNKTGLYHALMFQRSDTASLEERHPVAPCKTVSEKAPQSLEIGYSF
jgi:hypothetical protein